MIKQPDYQAGFTAYQTEGMNAINPYPKGTLPYKLWREGWMAALQTDAQRKGWVA